MAKFLYKFENIKRIKKTFEKEIQRQLSVLNLEIRKLKEYIEGLLNEKEEEKAKVLSKQYLNSSELHFYSDFEKLINKKIDVARGKIKMLGKEKEDKIIELTQKAKERKIFEKLEEHHLNDFKFKQNKLEQINIDDLASKKYSKS
ncbi:flagellar FliJ protein [bacterium BMS3Abin04]|nr:flagellar FliJ protein [bacterium BMS3Abin04]